MADKNYEGAVCYRDGWHWSVDDQGNPGEKLFLEEDGSYRFASDSDESWHDRHHNQFVNVEMI